MLDEKQWRFHDRVAVLDSHLDKMAKEMDEEFAPMLRDAKVTKEFLAGKGFRYFLNKFKESGILGSCLGACISVAISDCMRKGLEAEFVHGKRGIDINSIPAYNPNAAEFYTDALKDLSDVSFHLLEQVEACANQSFSYLEALLVMGVHEDVKDEAGTFTNLALGSTSSAGGVIDQSINSWLYCVFSALAQEILTDAVLTGTAINDNAGATLATTPDVSGSNPAALTVTMPILPDGLIVRLSVLSGLVFAYSPFKSILGLLIPTFGVANA
ncbi:hypothetical protein Tco_1530035 [Tanacetum coccineum]